MGRITACPAVGAPHKPPRVMRRSEQALYRSACVSWAGRTRARHGAPRMPGDGERTHLAGSLVPTWIVICGVHALGQSARGRLCGASPPPPAAACPDEQQLAAHEGTAGGSARLRRAAVGIRTLQWLQFQGMMCDRRPAWPCAAATLRRLAAAGDFAMGGARGTAPSVLGIHSPLRAIVAQK